MRNQTVEVFQITAPHFVAAVVAVDGLVTNAAPILRWTKYKDVESVLQWAAAKGYSAAPVTY